MTLGLLYCTEVLHNILSQGLRRWPTIPFNHIICNCIRIEEALSSCSASTGDIISTTERLQQELEVITQRQEIVSCFLQDYQLSNEEVPLPALIKLIDSNDVWLFGESSIALGCLDHICSVLLSIVIC